MVGRAVFVVAVNCLASFFFLPPSLSLASRFFFFLFVSFSFLFSLLVERNPGEEGERINFMGVNTKTRLTPWFRVFFILFLRVREIRRRASKQLPRREKIVKRKISKQKQNKTKQLLRDKISIEPEFLKLFVWVSVGIQCVKCRLVLIFFLTKFLDQRKLSNKCFA